MRNIIKSLKSEFAPVTVHAHCDIPCGIYDPAGAVLAQFAVPVESYTAPIGKLFVTVEPAAPSAAPTATPTMMATRAGSDPPSPWNRLPTPPNTAPSPVAGLSFADVLLIP